MRKARRQIKRHGTGKVSSLPKATLGRRNASARPERKKLLLSFGAGAFFGIAATIVSFFIIPSAQRIQTEPEPPKIILSAPEAELPSFPKVFIAEEPLPEDAVIDDFDMLSEIGELPSYPVIRLDKPLELANKNLWKKYAVKVGKLPPNAPKIALIIDDLGIDKKRSAKIINLPAPLTASFISYAGNLEAQINKAKKTGKEIMLHIPMEAESTIDTGPGVLTTAMSASEIADALQKSLPEKLLKQGIVGVNNHMGSKFTKNPDSVRAFMKAYAAYGLLFIDSRTASGSSAVSIADAMGIAAAGRNVFIDNKDNVDYILGQLRILEKSARKNGTAIGIGHPHDGTIKALEIWLPTLADKGIFLVPTSYIVQQRISAKPK